MAEIGVDQSQKHSSDGSVSSPRPALKSKQVACFDKQIYEMNTACMRGEHWLAFECSWRGKERSCACGRVRGDRPLGFVLPKERPVYQIPTNINGDPCNFGAGFVPEAVQRFRGSEKQILRVRELSHNVPERDAES